ncbi:MAG: cytochrome c oxidase subunit 3 [Alphaproteobacteria bacterium]|nr:cytochrome c oxidase subunit 3 [Alphaproteobacteria bacterium]
MAETPEFGTTGKPHPYHLVRPSIWPLIGAFSAMTLAIGGVLFMHEVKVGDFNIGLKGAIFGLLAVLACMFFWWKDIIFESVKEKVHNNITEKGLKLGMALFISSEVMFFFAFFWAFFDASLFAGQENMFARVEHTDGHWPPPHIEVVSAFDLPFLMTLILLLSGCTVTWAHHAILEGHQKQAVQGLGLSVLLGFIFLCFQIYEYSHLAFGFTEGIYPSTFYMATGFHGFHVLIGTIFLFVCWLRALKGHFTPKSHFGFEAAAWYWHFVDVVWLFLFVAVYWWGGLDGTVAGH